MSTPQQLTALVSGTTLDRDPWISPDGKRLYFARNPGQQGRTDIYFTERTSVTDEFPGPGTALVNLDRGDADDDRASLSGDEKTLVLASDRPPPSAPPPNPKVQIFITTRNAITDDFGSPAFGDPRLAMVNADPFNHYDPFLTADGRKLYFAPDVRTMGRQEIRVATRPTAQGNFGAPQAVAALNVLTSAFDPALTPDEKIIVFTGAMGNQDNELYYAVRENATDPFGAPVKIPNANSDENDGDPMLSDDGCDLYFASRRVDNRYHVFHARITK